MTTSVSGNQGCAALVLPYPAPQLYDDNDCFESEKIHQKSNDEDTEGETPMLMRRC